MSAPPQARPNPTTVAEQKAAVFQLKLAGHSHDWIAAHLGVSHGTVANRLKAAIADHVAPLAQEYADTREAELSDLYARAYAIVADPKKPDDARLKAIGTCLRVNESRRKLRGADAPESLSVTHMANLDLSGDLVGDVLTAVIPAIAAAAGTDHGRRMELEAYGMTLARWVLLGREGPEPACPPARLAITAGTAESRSERPPEGDGPPGPWTPGGDGAERVLSELQAFEDEFGPIEGDDKARRQRRGSGMSRVIDPWRD